MRQRGFSLVEATVVVGIILVMAAVAAPAFRALFADAHILGAGQEFRSQFRLAWSTAVRLGVYSGIRFERLEDGRVFYSVYSDGNANGVRSADIASGVDPRIAGPFPLSGRAPSVRVGINPGVPNMPPATGELSGDPVRTSEARKPLASAIIATNTATTSATPRAVIAVDTGRWRMLLRLYTSGIFIRRASAPARSGAGRRGAPEPARWRAPGAW